MHSHSGRPSPQRWQQIQDLFDELVELPIEERRRRLVARCRGDPALHHHVASLLAAHDRADAVLHALEHPDADSGAPAPPRAPAGRDPYRLVGRTIAQYRIVQVLGGGGMGVVYRAEDTRLGRSVALKFLPRRESGDPSVHSRFLREAQVASALDHPNVCAVHGFTESEDGGVFIAMTYYDGQSLREKLTAGPLPLAEGLRLAIQITDGLAAVHHQGIIHRDIKPANVMVTAGGTAKILDFGLAKFGDVTLTQAGRTMGTVAYMSPEQAQGRVVDARTDLWSLGVMLYEMLTAQRPFRGDHEQSVIYAILNQEPEPPRTLRADTPAALERVVLKLLEKDPARRYRDAAALLADLRAIRDARQPPVVGRELAATRTRVTRRRIGTAAAALLVISGGVWGARQLRPPPAAPAGPVRWTTIAVFPFAVDGGDDLAYLGAGMVDLLTLKLDATGSVRSLTPRVVLSHLARTQPGVPDPATSHPDVPGGGWAAEAAQHFLADYFIVGEVTRDRDRVRFSASIHTAQWREPLGVAEVMTDPAVGVVGAIDALADSLIARLPAADGRHAPPLATLTTGSLPALRAYLQGRQADRRLDAYASNELMRRAVAADSTFALPWFYLAFNRSIFGGGDELDRTLALRADLPARQRAHLDAYAAYLEGRAPDAERLYRRIVTRHDDDVDAWRMLGATLTLYNGFYGRPIDEAGDAFARALALDPAERRARYWLLELAAARRRIEEFDSLATLSARDFAPGTAEGQLYRLLPRLTGATPSARAAILAELDGVGLESVTDGIEHYARRLGDLATLLRLSESATAPANPPRVQARGRRALVLLEAAQGRLDAAKRQLAALVDLDPGWAGVLRVSIAALPHAPTTTAELSALRQQIAVWDTSGPLTGDTHIGGWADLIPYMQGLVSVRLGDHAATRAFAQRLERRGAAQDRGIPAGQMGATLDALDAWTRPQPQRALVALDDAEVDLPLRLRDSPWHSQALNRYVRGEVLYGEGRYDDALPWFASLNTGVDDDFVWLFLGPAQLRIAQIHERLGRVDQAADHYRRFLELWRECDPELRPMTAEAARRLAAVPAGASATRN